MCFLYGNESVKTSVYLRSFYRKYGEAVGMQFTERRMDTSKRYCVNELTLEPGGAVRPRNAYTAFSSLALKKAS